MNKIHLSDLRLPELWERAKRSVYYALLLLASLLLQNVILSHIAIFGVRCMFMPAVVVAVALFEGGMRGGIFGLGAGILCDLFFFSQTVLFTVLFPVIGFVVGLLTDFYLNRRFFTYSIMAVLSLFLAAFGQMFQLLIYKGQNSFALWWTAILQTLWSVPFIFPAYYLCKMIPRKSGGQVPSPY